MKNNYWIFIIGILLLSSCTNVINKKKKENELQTKDLIENLKIGDFEILEIDSCEYIIYKKSPNRNMGFGFMAHKGNCKNSIHQNKTI